MKTKDIAARYGFDPAKFTDFVWKQSEVKVTGFNMNTIADEDVPKIVDLYNTFSGDAQKYRAFVDEYQASEGNTPKSSDFSSSNVQAAIKKKQEKEAAIANILISSGFNFEGYRITKYSGYISGDDAVQIPRGGIFGKNHGQDLTDALVKIRIQALRELKEAAYDLGCNAVIGVDFDYITLEPETANITGGTLYEPYVICVTANGNAVIIEKE